jgi:protein ImuB
MSPDNALRLTGFGLRRLGEVLRLPRASLGARLGKGFVLDLARALGEVDEPLPWFEFPETFEATLELPAPVESAPVLLFAARRLIASLSGWLAARNVALREMHWLIDYGHGDCTELPLRFSAPVHARERIERVLKEALDRLRLRAPALVLRLRAEHAELRDARSALLFDSAVSTSGDERLAELLDRLVARLGQAAVVHLRCHADYRPEMATQCTPANAQPAKVGADETTAQQDGRAKNALCVVADGGTASVCNARPLRLLNVPRALSERHGRPFCDGPLTLLAGPERIESGWWDGADARRDYFIALDQRQRWLWLFRTGHEGHGGPAAAGWFLHGEFV